MSFQNRIVNNFTHKIDDFLFTKTEILNSHTNKNLKLSKHFQPLYRLNLLKCFSLLLLSQAPKYSGYSEWFE